MSNMQSTIDYARTKHMDYLNDLIDFTSIPSISTLPKNKNDLRRAAEWLSDKLCNLDMDKVEVISTGGNPIVYGEYLKNQGEPTVLIYGHYDVQPADPIDEWKTPPFEPTVLAENVYGRGVSDMKAQMVALLAALDALQNYGGGVQVNLKFLLEGEEEIGSPHLKDFILANKKRLSCDFSLNHDAGILAPDLPSIVYSLRGMAYFELWVYGPQSDLHSGFFGGVIHNPAQVISDLISGMHDSSGRVTLPGFYDKVIPLSNDERETLARIPYDEETHRKQAVSPPAFYGEVGYTNIERIGARPTLEINGLLSGFTGMGSKTVIPSKAMAKISMRLVADQDPLEVGQQLKAYLEQNAPSTIQWELNLHHYGYPVTMKRETPYIHAAAGAMKTVFGVYPVFRRDGATVPVVSLLKKELGVETVMMGFQLPDDGIHGPNEKQHLPTFYRGIESYIHLFNNLVA
jgi:acetylornithine deacetylase/succinyl-diaminopimelate desuccinylase-like protein